METSLTQALENFVIEEPLKKAITNLFAELEAVAPELPRRYAMRLINLSEHLLHEISDPTTPVHWWELTLDLAIRWTQPLGERGQAVESAALEVRRMLRQRMGAYEPVELVEITEDTARGIILLSETLTEPQRSMVADNAVSLAQAHFSKYAWFRAIYAGKAPVGFLMLYDNDEEPDYFLWRFVIASPYQGHGYGRQALDRLTAYVRTRPNARELGVSCGQGPGSPEEFYKKYGFIPTGVVEGEEVVLKIAL